MQNTHTFFKEKWCDFKEIAIFLLGSDVPSGPPYRTDKQLGNNVTLMNNQKLSEQQLGVRVTFLKNLFK